MTVSSNDRAGGIPVEEEARSAREAVDRERRQLTETERAIAGAESYSPQEALARTELGADQDTTPGAREPMIINLGPQHPSTHGVLRLVTQLDGEVVRDLHRNAGQPDQSYSERQIYEAALDRLARELAAVERIDKDVATQKLNSVLQKVA